MGDAGGKREAYELKDACEIDARIRGAQGAFQVIRKQFFSAEGIKNVHKRIAYEGLVFSIILYGCETWSLPIYQLLRLQMFQNSCVSAVCRQYGMFENAESIR